MKQIHYYGESVFCFIPAGKHFIRIPYSRHDTEPLPKFKMDHIVKKNTYICKICVQVSGRCYSRLQTKTSPNFRARNFIVYGKGQYAGIVPLV